MCEWCTANYLTCTQCVSGYALNNNQCQKCSIFIFNCTQCTSPNVCVACQTGFGVFFGVCELCADSNCLQCSTDYAICTQCKVGFVVSSGFCTYSCSIANCFSCSSANYCDTCVSPYGVRLGQCVSCTGSFCT